MFKDKPESSAGQILRNVRRNLPDVVSDQLPGTHALKNKINRIRSKILGGPANPTTLEDLGDIPDEFKHILTRGTFLLVFFKY